MIMANNFLDHFFALRNKKVMVTGCCGQLGMVICKSFLDVGSIVIGVDLDVEKGNRIDDENISYHSCDITKKESLSNLFNDLYDIDESVDVLINNAGVSTFENFEDRTETQFEWVTDVNLKGTFLCTQEYFKHQGKNKSGNIVNIASIYGVISPDPRIYEDGDRKNSEVYGATKAGVIQMTKYFAIHLAQNGIRVNSVSPGGIYNPENPQKPKFVQEYSKRNPMRRMANADEMTGAILFLSSNASTYVTGINLMVDGGMSCW
jgi:NAD(P)-dependent dehydrogenase (short-subunit alcohol dehydrogenase family)